MRNIHRHSGATPATSKATVVGREQGDNGRTTRVVIQHGLTRDTFEDKRGISKKRERALCAKIDRRDAVIRAAKAALATLDDGFFHFFAWIVTDANEKLCLGGGRTSEPAKIVEALEGVDGVRRAWFNAD